MVSTWPFSQGKSKTFKPLQEHGYAVYTNGTAADSVDWPDGVCGHPCCEEGTLAPELSLIEAHPYGQRTTKDDTSTRPG